MSRESQWKKNPVLNIGALMASAGLMTLVFFERAELLGTVLAASGFGMFFVGYRKAKASGELPFPTSDMRRRNLRIVMISLVAGFLVSPVLLWQQISQLPGAGIWFFVFGDIVCLLGLLAFFTWQYKRAGQVPKNGA